MWRERVYSGTLRPKSTDVITGSYLNDVLNELACTVRSNPTTSISDIHSINKITNGLYLGDKYSAKDKRFLVRNGITHVVNTAEGIDEFQVNTDDSYYKDSKIKYLGIPGHDRPSWNISVYFEKAAKFIDEAIKGGGNVLIHCVAGISRSATILLAYLMICRNMNAVDALQFVFRRRKIYPNPGFLYHLAQLNTVLQKPSYHYLTKYY